MELKGMNFIGNELSGIGKEIFSAVNPVNNEKISPGFHEAAKEEINDAVQKAEDAFNIYRNKSGKEKASFLEAIGEEIMNLGHELIIRCCEETGLPEARITGERGRTVNQLKLFAGLLREGSWVDARIETAEQDRKPLPKPDIRSVKKALGPVGIFGASNFPLAFSVAGGDTASALAAGCTIVVKAHPAHPGTCEMIGSAIRNAVMKSNMPDGTFSMVHGVSTEVGMAIVKHMLIKAIGFTGSFRGGKAIFDAAVQRPEPIPVYAEMGSTNPVFILPGALKEKKEEIAKGLTASVTLGVGQFCTNPGLVFYENSEDAEKFRETAVTSFREVSAGTMLTEGIKNAYKNGVENIKKYDGINLLAEGKPGEGNNGTAYLIQTDASCFLSNEKFEDEIFGPSTLNVTANDKPELIKAAKNLKGHLTSTIHATKEDLKNYKELIEILERKAGRLIINGYPTGVEVCHSMVHGGPFPATTDSKTTSVGTLAINRFTRPVSYQNFPDEFLPDELKNDNPLGIWRLINGEMKNAHV
ncbi:MAG: aldehyde dehydrogenase (NADP(+)) [Ignavibacteriaceae bacterium]